MKRLHNNTEDRIVIEPDEYIDIECDVEKRRLLASRKETVHVTGIRDKVGSE